jgi:hypothetical protein
MLRALTADAGVARRPPTSIDRTIENRPEI